MNKTSKYNSKLTNLNIYMDRYFHVHAVLLYVAFEAILTISSQENDDGTFKLSL